MKKPSRFLRLIGVAGLLATLLAGVFATPVVYAGDPDPDPSDDGNIGDIWDTSITPFLQGGPGGLYYPWVGNDDESTGLGPADTSVSVMNISPDPAVVFAWVGSHDSDELPDTGGWDIVGPFFLAPWASKTFTAAQLGIAEGTGAPVAFSGFNELWTEGGSCTTVLGGSLAAGNDVNGNGRCSDVEVYIGSENDDPSDPDLCRVDDSNGDRTNNYQGVYNGGGGLNNDGDCNDAEQGNSGGIAHIVPTVLGGIAKQAVDGETLPYTTAADTSVSGYNAIGGMEIIEFADWYFPIAQTNCGPGGCWNTILRIANFGNIVDGEVGNIGSAAVTARFFPADDAQGSLDTGFQLQALVNSGDVWNIDISDYVPEGWVGSVHVYSDSNVFAMADRVKVGYGAWITNTASNAPYTNAYNVSGSLGQYVLFAPDVRLDFYGWNTGINVANLVNEDNNINIQYFNLYGNAPTTLTRRLAPQGMTYFYDPSQAPQDNSQQDPSSDVNADIIGSALIWSDYPVAAAIDATKYPESTTSEDPNIFQAMSYSATGNVYTTQVHPLVQKGNPTTGMGATSGINIMNPNATAAQATVWWVNPSGFGADNYGTSAVAIPGFANGFVYTLASGNLPNGFYGSAVVMSTLPVASVTTQVDYQVEWDGTAVWLGYNPCGFYRDNGGYDDSELAGYFVDSNCNLGDPFNTQGGQVSKTFHDETGAPIVGVYAELWNETYYQREYLGNESYAGVPWVATGYSNVDGEIEWTNVPVGTYYLAIEGVPTWEDDFGDLWDQYEGYGDIEGPFTLNEGEDIDIDNVLERILPVKYVYLGDDAAGVEVCVHMDDDGDGELDADEAAEPEACDQADGSELGQAVFEDLEPGWYFISVNQGLEYDQVAGFNPQVFGPEYFELGGLYINDLTNAVNPAEGNIQKVIVLPEEFCEGNILAGTSLQGNFIDCDNISISGIIGVFGPDGELESEGNVQSEFADFIGPNGEAAFSLTDFNVPVGVGYEIGLDLTIAIDHDLDPNTAPIEYSFVEYIDATDAQVICEDYLDPSDECVASPDAPAIAVYEGLTTRVFNDLTEIVTGQLDVYVRDDENDDPIFFAFVCLNDAANNPISCAFTDADGHAAFPNTPAGVYTITAVAGFHEWDSVTAGYIPAFDLLLGDSGGPFVDLPGDTFGGLNLDIEMALDPQDTALDVLVAVDDNANSVADGPPADEGVNGVQVLVWLTDPFGGDVAGLGGVCASGQLVGSSVSATMPAYGEDRDGMTEFGVDYMDSFCIQADPNGDGIQTTVINATVPQFDPDDDIDYIILEGPVGVIDINVLPPVINGIGLAQVGPGLNGVDVFFFVADSGDSYGATGVCAGAFVGTDVTGVENVDGTATNGIASLEVDTAQEYCVSIDPVGGNGLGGPAPNVGPIALDPADQDDDIDGVLQLPAVP